jgi:hypothetical protein
MNKLRIILIALLLSGCSGLMPDVPFAGGKIVSPEYLSRYEGGGSMSTIWYYGSDDKYHYFSHLVKASTKYRVLKEDLDWEIDFPYKSERARHIDGELKNHVNLTREQRH